MREAVWYRGQCNWIGVAGTPRALSRLRAWQVLGDERARAEAVTALDDGGAQRAGAAWRARGLHPVHGLAGNGDVLLHGGWPAGAPPA